MTKWKRATGVALGITCAFTATTAMSADKRGAPIATFENTEVYESVPRWQGFYYGVSLGYGWG